MFTSAALLPFPVRPVASAIALAIASLFPVHADDLAPLLKTIAGPREGTQGTVFFGTSVAASSTYAVVGEPGGQGFVKIFDAATGALWMSIPNPTGEPIQFGASVALAGSMLAVGAPDARAGAVPNAGRIYVYNLSSNQPLTPVLILSSPTPRSGEAYGSAVSLAGDRLVAGVPKADQSGKIESGQVYVYDIAAANPQSPVMTVANPSPADADFFGASVAISGQRLVVGAPGEDTGAKDAGRAYAYDLTRPTPTAPVVTLAPPVLQASLAFGQALSLSGSTLAIGASSETVESMPLSGRVYLYELAGTRPSTPSVILRPSSPAEGELFGLSIAISGRRVLAGTAQGRCFAFNLTEGPQSKRIDLPDALPDSQLALALSGNLALIGNPAGSVIAALAGSAYLRDLAGDGVLQELVSPTPRGDDQFASSLVMTDSLLIAGAPRHAGTASQGNAVGRVSLHELSSESQRFLDNPTPANGDEFGATLTATPDFLLVGSPGDTDAAPDRGAGTVYLYDWSFAQPPIPIPNPRPDPGGFGSILAAAGPFAVIGSKANGVVFVFDLRSPSPSQPVATLVPPGSAPGNFPWAIAMHGTTVAISDTAFQTTPPPLPAPQEGEDPPGPPNNVFGAVALYNLTSPSGSISPFVTLPNPVPPGETVAYFGDALAMDATRLAVAALVDSPEGKPERVHLYSLGGTFTATPQKTFTPPISQSGDGFGGALAFSGDQLAVGAPNSGERIPMDPPFENTLLPGTGEVLLYDLDPETPGYLGTIGVPGAPQAPRLASGYRFGAALGANGNKLAVGAPAGGMDPDKRSAFVFGPGSRRPSLSSPVPGAIHRSPVPIAFILRQIPRPGSLRLAIGDRELVLSGAFESPGPHQFAFDPADPGANDAVSSGPPIPDGTYTLALRYLDREGTEVSSSLVPGVTIDTTPPLILPPDPIGVPPNRPTGAIVHYPPPVVTDAGGIASITYSIPGGTLFPLGATSVTLTARDPAGNVGTSVFPVSVLPLTTGAPRSGAVLRASGKPVTVSGTTHRMVTRVLVSVNGGEPVAASLTPNSKNQTWSFPIVNPRPWENIIRVTAIAGDASVTGPPLTFFHEIPTPLTVNIAPAAAGSIQFSPPLGRGNTASLGRPYTATAIPASGQVFDQWSGLATGPSPTTTFTHAQGGRIGAGFLPTPFPTGIGGTYNAALPTNSPDLRLPENSGFLTLQITNSSAAFSARVVLDNRTTSFRGWFQHADGRHQSSSPDQGIALDLRLDTTAPIPRITGTVSRRVNGTTMAILPVTADQTHTAANPVPIPMIGTFNCAFPLAIPPAPAADSPSGEGTATLTVSRNGALRWTGTLADGSSFTSSAFLTRSAQAPIHAIFNRGTGLLVGQAGVDPSADTTDVSSDDLSWFQRNQPTRHYFPAGFTLPLQIIGARQTTSTPGSLQLSPQPVMILSEGPFPLPIEVPLARTATNRYASPDRTTGLTLGTNGTFSGTHTPPPPVARLSIKGIIISKGDTARTFGSFLTASPKKPNGTGRAGSVRILAESAPPPESP
jgi:hypothetical protein